MADEIRRDFKRWVVRHPNFMTPNIIGVRVKGKKIIEISHGRGMEGRDIYGVTEITQESTGNFKTGRGEMFYDRHSAETYAKKLKKVA
jgi:hypothetical protein